MKSLNIALVAHDSRKKELLEWCKFNWKFLSKQKLFGTGTTAKLISEICLTGSEFIDDVGDISVYPFKDNITQLLSGPLGGDQQIGALIAEGKIDVLIFFCDNLITQGHHNDVNALTRLASLYNIAFATNRTTADYLLTSPLITDEHYNAVLPAAIENYKNRKL